MLIEAKATRGSEVPCTAHWRRKRKSLLPPFSADGLELAKTLASRRGVKVQFEGFASPEATWIEVHPAMSSLIERAKSQAGYRTGCRKLYDDFEEDASDTAAAFADAAQFLAALNALPFGFRGQQGLSSTRVVSAVPTNQPWTMTGWKNLDTVGKS